MSRIILDIDPQPWVKSLPSEAILFRIPEKCFYIEEQQRYPTKEEREEFKQNPDNLWFGCAEFKKTGLCRHTLRQAARARKKRLIKYKQYKKDLQKLAQDIGFQLPLFGCRIYFYFPVSSRWSKKKKRLMHGQMKFNKPDYDNCLKAIQDALMFKDEKVAQISGTGKFWVSQERGYIEILTDQEVYNPFNIEFIDQGDPVKLKQLLSGR